MKSGKFLATLLSLLMLFSLALGGCSSATDDTDSPDTNNNNPPASETPTTPTGSQLIASILAASPNITSFDMTSMIDMTMQVSGMNIKTVMTANGKEDLGNKRAYLTSSVIMSGDLASTMELETYMIGSLQYFRITNSDQDTGMQLNTWYKMLIDAQMQSQTWDSQSQQNDYLFSKSTITIDGSETINGVSCWKVTITPDLAELIKYLNEQQAIEDSSAITNPADSLKNIKMTAWVAKDTSFVIKMNMTMDIITEAQTMSLVMSTTITNINQPVTITLPPDAVNAIQLG
ncbi:MULTISPECIES: DUF6612 family protein [Dehalococcoides]|uniref:DUF6612 family protein n=1 Tax=Dehalococcoides TaxID=61434 RepID=UPI0005B56563|nr:MULTISPECIES: DUF6612 family protein [Dehalococcoides]QYY58488.1 hypothetical protein CWV2_000398 [Dehalococcoides mccartyi]BAQ34212.1 hypothetical protein UCH007_02540 [Dehalococcoides sp. UCH007]